MAAGAEQVLVRPLLRGVFHQIAFSVSLVVGTLLIVGADGPRRHVAAAVFAGAVAVCFGISALYHRITWSPSLRLWMRRADHAGVYLLIAGTYTPVCLLVLTGTWRWAVAVIVWTGAAAAAILKFAWVGAPKWLAAAIGIALGWTAIVVLPQLASRLPPSPPLALDAPLPLALRLAPRCYPRNFYSPAFLPFLHLRPSSAPCV